MRAELVNRNEVIENTELMTYVSLKIRSKDLGEIPTPLDVEFKKFYDDRTKDQNSKYWVTVKQIARLLNTSTTEVHHTLLSRYGSLATDKEGNPIKLLMEDDFDFMNETDLHLQPTKKVVEIDGKLHRWFYQLKNSSEMKSDEFSALLEGALSELEEMK